VLVVPDVIANAGGVTVSYFEWVQDFSSFFWTEDEINARLVRIMKEAFAAVWQVAQDNKGQPAHGHLHRRVQAHPAGARIARPVPDLIHANPAHARHNDRMGPSNKLLVFAGRVKGHPQWSSGTLPFEGKVVGLLSASPGALGGLQSLSHLAPLLANLQCWVAPTRFSLSRAGEAFDADGRLASEGSRERVRAVVEQVLWASQRLHCP
jgi:hypothetical protein